jgi:hypothetical protein
MLLPTSHESSGTLLEGTLEEELREGLEGERIRIEPPTPPSSSR